MPACERLRYKLIMSYSEFTLESVGSILGVTSRAADLFPGLQPVAPPTWLQEQLARGMQGIQLSLISEKSRSEFIVAPILLAGRELSGNRFGIYSGLLTGFISPSRFGWDASQLRWQ